MYNNLTIECNRTECEGQTTHLSISCRSTDKRCKFLLTQANEAKNLIKRDDLYSQNSQSIYIDIGYETTRHSLPNKQNDRQYTVDDFNGTERQTMPAMSLSDEIEYYKQNIEVMKTSINEYQGQIDKLNNQIERQSNQFSNLTSNKNMLDLKRKGSLH
jgi:hypothetical protein